MGAYERMRQVLSPMGIYRLDKVSMIETKLRLIGAYLDIVENKIGKLSDSYFVDTSGIDGLKAYRAMYCMPTSLAKARVIEMVQKRMSITNRDFTKQGVLRCIESGGFQAQLTERPASGEVEIKIIADYKAFGTQAEKEAFIRSCLPCHVKPVFVW